MLKPDPKNLAPGTIVVGLGEATKAVLHGGVLKERKDDDSGWWLHGGGGLSDWAFDRWTIVARDEQAFVMPYTPSHSEQTAVLDAAKAVAHWEPGGPAQFSKLLGDLIAAALKL